MGVRRRWESRMPCNCKQAAAMRRFITMYMERIQEHAYQDSMLPVLAGSHRCHVTGHVITELQTV